MIKIKIINDGEWYNDNVHQGSCNSDSLLLASRQLGSSLPNQKRAEYKLNPGFSFDYVHYASYKYKPVCQTALEVS